MRLSSQLISIALFADSSHALGSLEKGADTVAQPPSAEISVFNMPSLKAKKLGKLAQEKVTCRTLKEIRQQYLMSQGSPPRMKIAGLFSAE